MKRKNRKGNFRVTAIFVLLAMIMMLVPMTALANATVVDSGIGSDVESITISGNTIYYCTQQTPYASNNGNVNNMTYTFNTELSASTSDTATITATFVKDGGSSCTISSVPRISAGPYPTVPAVIGGQSLVYDAVLSAGGGSATAYVFPDLMSDYTRYDTYVLNYSKETRVNPAEDLATGLTLRFGDPGYPPAEPESYMAFDDTPMDGYDAVYSNGASNFYPDIVAFYVDDAADLTAMTSNNVNNVAFREYSGGGYTDYASPTDLDSGFYTIAINAADFITLTTTSGSTKLYFDDPNSEIADGDAIALSVTSGESYYVTLTAENMSDFSSITYTVTYDDTVLSLTDLCAFTYMKETTTGAIVGTGITIVSVSSGEIELSVDKTVPTGYQWSGAVDILEFTALSTDDTTITVE